MVFLFFALEGIFDVSFHLARIKSFLRSIVIKKCL